MQLSTVFLAFFSVKCCFYVDIVPPSAYNISRKQVIVLNFEVINSKKREMGMTNAQLAEKTGVTLSTLDKITSGANQNPKLSTLQAIARVLGCTLDDFDDVNTLTI